ncbi:hypothetical protein EDC94DRAFT_692794 [Helicostylum pulchrum]|nr:hypothetical protein EDC94DRAFT_692794 [Helicostylum pulchrum]
MARLLEIPPSKRMLFKDDSELEIIGNVSISPCIRSIAIIMMNGLKDANENIIENIWNKFRA